MDNLNNLSTGQKIALGVGAAAAVGIAVATYVYARAAENEDIDEDEPKKKITSKESKKKPKKPVKKTSTKEKKDEVKQPVDDKLQKAADLRAEGNKAFSAKQYDEAIRLYTQALELSDVNSHLLYSNRSAAYLFKGDSAQALADAKKCMEIKPDWSKAYFRIGKALMASGENDEAFKYFYKGTKLDKNSDELQILLAQCAKVLGIGEKDSRSHTEREMVKLFSRTECMELCDNVLHVPFDQIREVIEKAVKENKLDSLLEDETLDKCVAEHALETYRVLAEVLLDLDRADEAHKYAIKANSLSPQEPKVLLLLVTTLLRSAGMDNWDKAFETMREAVRLASSNVQIIHTYASILLQQAAVGLNLPAPSRELLGELKKGLDNKEANHLLIADCGMRIWFKLLEEYTQELIAEEQMNVQKQIPPDQAYIYGLTKGAFSKVCSDPFFLQALSQVIFSNPGLETVLAPFRSSFLSLTVGENFNQLQSLIYALAIQSYRNNYSWPISPEDSKKLEPILESVQSKVTKNPEELVKDGVLDPEFVLELSQVSLFQPLYSISGLSPVIAKADRSKLHEWLVTVIHKTLDNFEEEMRIKSEEIKAITPISKEDPLIKFYDTYVPVWDSAGLAAGKLTMVKVKDELSWIFRKYTPKGFDGEVKTLIAGCGSGIEVYQHATYYKDMNITAVDISENRLAFAVRQHRELGKDKIQFYQADINELELSQLNTEPFDLIVVNNVLHHLADPIKAWTKLAGLLRSGGLMKVSLYSSKFVDLMKKTRTFLSNTQQFETPLFNSEKIPQLRRTPTIEDIRLARNLILSCEEKDLEELKELVTSPAFYALNEFAELMFHSQVVGFSFTVIGDCIQQLGLNLVGFEFPGLSQEMYLRYVVDYPDDPEMQNLKYLEQFSEAQPEAFKNFTHSINFVVEKP